MTAAVTGLAGRGAGTSLTYTLLRPGRMAPATPLDLLEE
jgi:hypothetical protein